MRTPISVGRLAVVFSLFIAFVGCDDDDPRTNGTGGAGGGGAGGTGGSAGTGAQVPPTGAAAIDAWLAAGSYKSWACLPAARAPLAGVSPHGQNRVCTNAALSAHGAGEYPVNSAAVKELYNSSGAIIGYSVSLHVSAGKTGSNWYWYEKIGATVAADAVGVPFCVSCHQGAGSDAAHPGHDFVYTQVR